MADANIQILIVDDEESLLRLLTVYLTRMGYSASGCTSASAARSLFGSDPHAFALAIVDLTLPDGRGDQLALDLLSMSPQLKVILFSGYVVSEEAFPPELRARVGVIQKPFVPQVLAAEVSRLLGS